MAESRESGSASKEGAVEFVDESVPVADNSSSKKDLKAVLKFQEDADLHPVGEPDSEPDKEPGGVAATETERPPLATARPDVPIISALATGAGQHTPPNPDWVDADGYSRPLKAEEA